MRFRRRVGAVLSIALLAALLGSSPVYAQVDLGTGSDIGTITQDDASSLVDSGYSLTQVDPESGSLMSGDVTQSLTDQAATANDLAQQGELAIDSANLARQAQQEADAKRKAQEQAASAQNSVGPDGCPDSAPSNTLRDGSSSIAIGDLCAQSVSGARSAAAAGAIKWALSHLGIPYSEAGGLRNGPDYYDCSSFVSHAYQAAGVNIAPPGINAPTTDTIRAARWAVQIPFSSKQPGDLVEPISTHVVMALADGWMVHTNHTGDVSHVSKMYTSAYWTGYINPSSV